MIKVTEDKVVTPGRLTPQVHKCHPTQPTPELASRGLESTFLFYIASRSKLRHPLSIALSGWTQWALPKHPWMAQTPCMCPQAPYNTRTFPGQVPTHRPEGNQQQFFGKIPMRPGPYGPGRVTATFSSSSGRRQQCQSFTGYLRYVEQKWFRTPWGALKQYDILSNLIQFHIFCQCFPNFVVLRIWQPFLFYPYKTGSAFKEKCAQAKSASSLPAIMGTFSISFAFLYEPSPSHSK